MGHHKNRCKIQINLVKVTKYYFVNKHLRKFAWNNHILLTTFDNGGYSVLFNALVCDTGFWAILNTYCSKIVELSETVDMQREENNSSFYSQILLVISYCLITNNLKFNNKSFLRRDASIMLYKLPAGFRYVGVQLCAVYIDSIIYTL